MAFHPLTSPPFRPSRNPLVSSSRLDRLMEGRKMLRLSILQRYLSTGSNEGDWVTMGVIVNKLPPKTSSKVDSNA